MLTIYIKWTILLVDLFNMKKYTFTFVNGRLSGGDT